MSKSLQEWLGEGEQLHAAALAEYQSLQAQLDELEARLAAKQVEVNQIAEVIGKPPVESHRRISATIIDPERDNRAHIGASPAAIARALTGRQMTR